MKDGKICLNCSKEIVGDYYLKLPTPSNYGGCNIVGVCEECGERIMEEAIKDFMDGFIEYKDF